MRQRIEDLGRIQALLTMLYSEFPLFNYECRPSRPKDYEEWWEGMSEDKKDDVLRAWVYGIDELRDRIIEILEIAEGTDPLNEMDDSSV